MKLTDTNITNPANPAGRPEPFVTEPDAAAFLKVSERTLQRWRVEPPTGGGPRFFKIGKRVAYRLSGLAQWAEERAFESTSEIDA